MTNAGSTKIDMRHRHVHIEMRTHDWYDMKAFFVVG